MTCDDYRAARLAGDTTPETHAHVAGCSECAELDKTLASARSALADVAVWEEPAPDLEERVLASITEAPEAQSTGRPAGRAAWLIASWAAAAVVIAFVAFAVTRPPPPDWEVALVSTDAAPNATATVLGWNEAAGTRVAVTVEGLDPAPEGFFYEFWFSKGPVHVSAGTFHSPGDVELWAGVSRADYPRLWITLERTDEDESPSVTVLDTAAESSVDAYG